MTNKCLTKLNLAYFILDNNKIILKLIDLEAK